MVAPSLILESSGAACALAYETSGERPADHSMCLASACALEPNLMGGSASLVISVDVDRGHVLASSGGRSIFVASSAAVGAILADPSPTDAEIFAAGVCDTSRLGCPLGYALAGLSADFIVACPEHLQAVLDFQSPAHQPGTLVAFDALSYHASSKRSDACDSWVCRAGIVLASAGLNTVGLRGAQLRSLAADASSTASTGDISQVEPLEMPFRELYAGSLQLLSPSRVTQAPSSMWLPPEAAAGARHLESRRVISEAVSKLVGREVDAAEPLMGAGLDSVAAVELGRTLSDALGFTLPATAFFDYPSVDALAEYVDGRLAERGGAFAPVGEVVRPYQTASGSGPLAVLAAAGLSPHSTRGDSGAADVAFEDGATAIPWTRWDVDAFAAEGDARFGVLLRDVAPFDGSLFGVSRTEAVLMDPQQRLLLHSSAEALGGCRKYAATGVFIGIQQMCACK